MPSLLKEIEAEAINANVPIANVLRKFAVLAARLKNHELRDWAFKELNGYPDGDIPQYRVVAAAEHIYNQVFIGNHTGNIAIGRPGATQTMNVEQGDLGGLVTALKEIGIPDADVKVLEGAHGMIRVSWW